MIKITCTSNEKSRILKALNKTNTCPFNCACYDLPNNAPCDKCKEKNIKWDIQEDHYTKDKKVANDNNADKEQEYREKVITITLDDLFEAQSAAISKFVVENPYAMSISGILAKVSALTAYELFDKKKEG